MTPAEHKLDKLLRDVSARAGQGHDAADPIFIIGMPRAGSTLIEQILASHSQVEGTMELPDIPAMAIREGRDTGWVDALRGFSAQDAERLGAEFIERTRIQRKTDKPFFIDKLPNNWIYLAFIRLILPNAKIIDARRHPLDGRRAPRSAACRRPAPGCPSGRGFPAPPRRLSRAGAAATPLSRRRRCRRRRRRRRRIFLARRFHSPPIRQRTTTAQFRRN
jgi:hypothetical protein